MFPYSSDTAKTILAVLFKGMRIADRTWFACAIPASIMEVTSAAVRPPRIASPSPTIWATVRSGSSERSGSWKTSWT